MFWSPTEGGVGLQALDEVGLPALLQDALKYYEILQGSVSPYLDPPQKTNDYVYIYIYIIDMYI